MWGGICCWCVCVELLNSGLWLNQPTTLSTDVTFKCLLWLWRCLLRIAKMNLPFRGQNCTVNTHISTYNIFSKLKAISRWRSCCCTEHQHRCDYLRPATKPCGWYLVQQHNLNSDIASLNMRLRAATELNTKLEFTVDHLTLKNKHVSPACWCVELIKVSGAGCRAHSVVMVLQLMLFTAWKYDRGSKQ